jgi:hypothetical protein
MFASFDKRLTPIESMRRTLRWGIGTVFSAVAFVLLEFYVNHVHGKHP